MDRAPRPAPSGPQAASKAGAQQPCPRNPRLDSRPVRGPCQATHPQSVSSSSELLGATWAWGGCHLGWGGLGSSSPGDSSCPGVGPAAGGDHPLELASQGWEGLGDHSPPAPRGSRGPCSRGRSRLEGRDCLFDRVWGTAAPRAGAGCCGGPVVNLLGDPEALGVQVAQLVEEQVVCRPSWRLCDPLLRAAGSTRPQDSGPLAWPSHQAPRTYLWGSCLGIHLGFAGRLRGCLWAVHLPSLCSRFPF